MTDFKKKTEQSFDRLYRYCQKKNYKGWDNFDGLNSTLFKKSYLYRFNLCRLIWIQFFKRSPINFRSVTSVPEGYNAKGLALFASGLVSAGKLKEAKSIINRLKAIKCKGYKTSCWGYNFDWQSKLFLVPVGTPNIVTTVFVINAMLDYFEKTNDKECFKLAIEGCEFFLPNLVLFENEKHLCFGYMPKSKAIVHNVNMMASAVLARVYSFNKNSAYFEKSKKAMAFAVSSMTKDHTWVYGEKKLQHFIDNFHTGFNLVSLHDWMQYTGDYRWEDALKNAFSYFLKTFWLENGCPKYYHTSLYPIDIHGSAQGIVTCLKLARYDEQSMPMALRITNWALDNMQDKEGFFYYQKTRLYTNRIPYIRWSQAWMFYALSRMVY
jgi:hypothetical protein